MADTIEAHMRLNRMEDAYDATRLQQDATLAEETLRQHFQALVEIQPDALTREHYSRAGGRGSTRGNQKYEEWKSKW